MKLDGVPEARSLESTNTCFMLYRSVVFWQEEA
jgi:hypothetical protein